MLAVFLDTEINALEFNIFCSVKIIRLDWYQLNDSIFLCELQRNTFCRQALPYDELMSDELEALKSVACWSPLSLTVYCIYKWAQLFLPFLATMLCVSLHHLLASSLH
jgi:hypothetical protein